MVRTLLLDSQAEGCVADGFHAALYLAQEEAGIMRFSAEPDGGNAGVLVARVGENGLTADVEGLALYESPGGAGYLIASSQGSSNYKVYERAAGNRFVMTIDPKPGAIDDVSETDGIAVTSCATSPRFAQGVFLVQDGDNDDGNQNFKLFAWQDIAGIFLRIEAQCPAR